MGGRVERHPSLQPGRGITQTIGGIGVRGLVHRDVEHEADRPQNDVIRIEVHPSGYTLRRKA